MLKNAAVGTGIQVIPQSVMGEIQLDIPSIEVQRLVVEMDRLRKKKVNVFVVKLIYLNRVCKISC